MSEKDPDVSNIPDPASGPIAKTEKDQVAYETYKKVLSQKKQVDLKLSEQAARLAEFEAKEEAEKQAALINEKKFDELSALNAKKYADLEAKHNALTTGVENGQKLQAVLEKLPGRLKHRAYYDMIDTDSVKIDPSTNDIDQDSVELVASNFMKFHGADLIEKPVGGKLPNDAPGGTTSSLSHAEWLKLDLKEKKARMGEVFKKHTE